MYETYLTDLKINFKGIANCVWHTTYKQYCNSYLLLWGNELFKNAFFMLLYVLTL